MLFRLFLSRLTLSSHSFGGRTYWVVSLECFRNNITKIGEPSTLESKKITGNITKMVPKNAVFV